MKYSKQRELILNYVLNHNDHPTADTIYTSLKKDNPKLSLGTVYRNLIKLTESNEIKKVSLPGEVDKFDKNLSPHAHLKCNICGCLIDINSLEIDNFIKSISKEQDIKIDNFNIIFDGVCKNCKNN
ncbi:Fur family transcriptional regulator [Fusobacterium perfoetens]|uniref:Fur family transcriptional regulator n=1 Tax=Fusobacterium perfoetens TaxID=852 RepID=UPI00048706A3|nr:transcriptional repressor [Fusobacterium perfoetens]MCI6152458.1 transcriptional repressor [Fusobacterium perfoetens]MDY3237726.1 transcriptional repressor [Fusobacterium perfoetens]